MAELVFEAMHLAPEFMLLTIMYFSVKLKLLQMVLKTPSRPRLRIRQLLLYSERARK